MVSFVVFKLLWALKFFSTIFTFHYFLRMLQSLMSFQFLLGRIIPSTVTSIFTYQTCTTNENYIKPIIFIPLEWHLLPKNVLITKYEGALSISKKRYILLPICVKNLHGRCHKWPLIDLGCCWWCGGPKKSIAIFGYKQRLLSLDMKTKIVQHVPTINISIWHMTCDMRHATCDMLHNYK